MSFYPTCQAGIPIQFWLIFVRKLWSRKIAKQSRIFRCPEKIIAGVTKQAPDLSSRVAMINDESSVDGRMPWVLCIKFFLAYTADGASPLLCLK
jgi:hypothetical protein